MATAALQGLVLLAGVMGLYIWSLNENIGEASARALAFAALVLGNLVLAVVDGIEPSVSLFDKRHRLIWIVLVLVSGALGAVLYVPWLCALFRVAPLSLEQVMLAAGVAAASGGWFGVVRLFSRLAARKSDNEQATTA